MQAMDWVPLRVLGAISRKLRTDSDDSEYTMLPNEPQSPSRSWAPHLYRRRHCCSWRTILHALTLRRLLFSLACTPILVFLAILCQGVPPSYEEIRVFEKRLPQHSVASLTWAGSQPPRFLRFPGHLWGHGLNNVLQEAWVSTPDMLPDYVLTAKNLHCCGSVC
jgi:hypothetical protein